MDVIDLAHITSATTALVGGKAVGLGALLSAGERAPDGFCLTTEAYRSGAVPERALRLITCGGSFDRSIGHYRDNIVVYLVAVAS